MPTAQLLAAPPIQTSDDEHLARRVQNFILARTLPAANFVEVEADGGIVTLTGRVGTFYQKQLWLNGAQRVAGVRRVIDEIEVVPLRAK